MTITQEHQIACKNLCESTFIGIQTGTIYISGTVTISNTQTWSGVKVQRASGFNLSFGNGCKRWFIDRVRRFNHEWWLCTLSPAYTYPDYIVTTYADNSAKAPLIVVNAGGSLNIADGAVLERNSNKPDTDSDRYMYQTVMSA